MAVAARPAAVRRAFSRRFGRESGRPGNRYRAQTGAGSVLKRTRDGLEIAAWMLKANPDVWDVIGHLDAGRVIDSWGVMPGYRADLMEPGDRCFVWVTGPRGSSWTPGIWAMGEVTSHPVPSEAEGRRLRVRLDVHGLQPRLPRHELRSDPRFAAAEILRLPRIGNPLIITPGEVAAIDEHLER